MSSIDSQSVDESIDEKSIDVEWFEGKKLMRRIFVLYIEDR